MTNVHLVGQQNQNWHAQNVLGIPRQHWDSTQDHNVTSWHRLAATCGAADVEREQPSSRRNLANRVLDIRGLRSTHEASGCCRVVGIPKRIDILDHRDCSRSYQGDNCDRAGLAELRQAVIRLRTADAQPTNPDDKKHLLLKTGEIKWCWKCGARVERDSAPRLLLKTACSGAPRTKEYERALSLLSKGQHPKSSVFVGLPSPISDEEWDQWHQDHGNLFFCLRELSSS